MKRLLISASIVLLIFLCETNYAQQKMTYPYTASYSSDFKIGNPANSKLVLELWKDFDNNTFDGPNHFADTVVMFFPDGSMLKGKDSVLAGAKAYRGAMKSCISTLDAWTPLKSVDKNEDWVALWGTETDTYADGKTSKKDIHEIWRINKDGKVDFMKQFSSMPPAGQ